MRVFITPITLVALASLTSCTPARVQTTEAYIGPALPRPEHVVVSYFGISPGEVRLDQGVEARIQRMTSDASLSTQEQQAAQATQVALARALVERLRSYGLSAELETTYRNTYPASTLIVDGQIVGIDRGNRTRRILVGLGAGKSSVSADAELFYVADTASQPRLLMSFQGEADSGRAPGMAETMGAGAVTQHVAESAGAGIALHGASETSRTSDTSEAGRLADALAKRIGTFAVSQGWIPASAIQ